MKEHRRLGMEFKYLGDVYSIPKSEYDFCRHRNLTRRLFSLAVPKQPITDRKLYHWWLYSYLGQDLEFDSCFSTNKEYPKRFNQIHNFATHLHYKNLTARQCKFLTTLTKNVHSTAEAKAIIEDAIKVFS